MKGEQLYFVILSILIMFVFSLTSLPGAQATAQVSGLISTDTTWTKNAGPYNLAGSIGVPVGVTLTIEPGTVVNFNDYYIQVNGTLSAKGTDTEKITLNIGTAYQGLTFTVPALLGMKKLKLVV